MRFKISKKTIIIILFFSIVLNILVFVIDIVPVLWPKIENKFFKEKTIIHNQKNFEEVIVRKSLEMAKSDNNITIWEEHKGFTDALFNFNKSKSATSKKYHYPRAFLYYGLSEYLIANNKKMLLDEFKSVFDKIITEDGNPKFVFDKVDQVPFGLCALNLYKYYKDEKYLKFSNLIYNELVKRVNKDGVILYREGFEFQYDDVLGMIVPFLMEYDKIQLNSEANEMAKNQLEFYIVYGVDKETFIPTHGIHIKSKAKVGSSNWGRGIGWYLLGLSKYYKVTGEYSKEFNGIYNILNLLKMKTNLWSQFPGSSSDFDASTSTMFMYNFALTGKKVYSKVEVFNLLGGYISNEGKIKLTSGDTYGLNNYSKSFGDSEFSQGMLLLLLSISK